jgi:hypothetical protein
MPDRGAGGALQRRAKCPVPRQLMQRGGVTAVCNLMVGSKAPETLPQKVFL